MQAPFQAVPFPAPSPALLPPQQHFQQLQPQYLLLPQPILQLQTLLHPQPLIQPEAAIGQKTLYVITYSSEVLKRYPNAETQLLQHIPNGVPALLTIYCHKWRAPPRAMCEMFSGVSTQVQQFLLGSRTAVGEM
jgi:hypothetical protein